MRHHLGGLFGCYRVVTSQSVSPFTRYSCIRYVGADFLLDHPVGEHWATTMRYEIQQIFCMSNRAAGYSLCYSWTPGIVAQYVNSKPEIAKLGAFVENRIFGVGFGIHINVFRSVSVAVRG